MQRKNIGERQRGKDNPFFGKNHSEEAKRKMSERRKGKKFVNRRKPPPFSKEHKEKIRATMLLKKEKFWNWKGGITENKQYRSWSKNKRNRVIKRLKIDGVSHTYGEWELLKKQYGYTCPCCKKAEPEIKLTEDHIIPLSKGGSDLIENIQPLCKSCNCRKSNKILSPTSRQ